MATPSLSSGDVSALIDHLLKSKDPATVSVRKILKSKIEKAGDYPLHPLEYEEFYVKGRTKEQFSEQERRTLDLEKQVSDLRSGLAAQEAKGKAAAAGAYEKGVAEGMARGEQNGRAAAKAEYDRQVQQMQERIGSFLAAMERSKKDIYGNAHGILLRLCMALTKTIVHAETITNPDLVLGVIKKSLSYIADRERIIVRVARDDLETVSKHRDFWLPVSERVDSISIEPDDRIEKGGCIIESNSGVADARLGVQFEELRELVDRIWDGVVHAAHPSSE
jgi:flagellar biosynthesis/type III secretory pathway protein FliH